MKEVSFFMRLTLWNLLGGRKSSSPALMQAADLLLRQRAALRLAKLAKRSVWFRVPDANFVKCRCFTNALAELQAFAAKSDEKLRSLQSELEKDEEQIFSLQDHAPDFPKHLRLQEQQRLKERSAALRCSLTEQKSQKAAALAEIDRLEKLFAVWQGQELARCDLMQAALAWVWQKRLQNGAFSHKDPSPILGGESK